MGTHCRARQGRRRTASGIRFQRRASIAGRRALRALPIRGTLSSTTVSRAPGRPASGRAGAATRRAPRSTPRMRPWWRRRAGSSRRARRSPRWRNWQARLGRSPSYFHRVFKAVTGLTPKDYAAADRAKKVRQGLAGGNSVTEAIYDAGFNSSGRFYEKSTDMLGMTPSQYRAGGANEEIRFAVGQSSLGAILGRLEQEGRRGNSAGRRSGQARPQSPGPFPESASRRRRSRLRGSGRAGGRSGGDAGDRH